MKNKMKKNIEYFHISPIENKESILLNGLKSDTKEIFVSDSEQQLILIASSQIFTNEYSVFKILPNKIKGKIIQDNVAEVGANHQFIIEQNIISPNDIVHLRDELWNKWELLELASRRVSKIFGFGAEFTLEFAIQYNEEWCNHYNKKYGKNIIYIESAENK